MTNPICAKKKVKPAEYSNNLVAKLTEYLVNTNRLAVVLRLRLSHSSRVLTQGTLSTKWMPLVDS